MGNEIIDASGVMGGKFKLVPASKEKRFVNFFIDYLAAVLPFVFLILLGVHEKAAEEDMEGLLKERLMIALIYVSYYVLVEGGLKGKTIGKFVTNTRTVNLDGSTPGFGTILKRSVSRVVPFEFLSFLGSRSDGWHDRWSDTIVIDVAKSHL